MYGDPVSFSFTDVQVQAIVPFYNPSKNLPIGLPIHGLNLLSLSTHRDHFPVTSLGHNGIQGYTSGHRTSAGSLGFTVLGEDPWAPVLRAYSEWRGYHQPLVWTGIDEVPPFDLSLLFVNQAGNSAAVLIRSIKITDTGRQLSTRDIQLTHIYAFMATRITTLIEGPVQHLPRRAGAYSARARENTDRSSGEWNQTFGPPMTFTTGSSSTSSSTSTSTTSSTSTTTASTTTSSTSTSSNSTASLTLTLSTSEPPP